MERMQDHASRPAGLNGNGQDILGHPLDRIGGPAKVTGTARYAFEGTPENIAYAAIVNAVYNACGVRVREMPITCDKLLAGLPPV